MTRFLVILIATLFPMSLLAADIEVSDAYARKATPASPAAAAYMVVTNTSDQTVGLIGAESPAAGMVMLHSSVTGDDGIVRMRPMGDVILLEPGASLTFESGGDHIMLMGLTEIFQPGTIVPLTLLFDRIDPVEIDLPIATMRQIETDG